MELSDLIALQERFDDKHGWSIRRRGGRDTIETASKELVGVMGEVGEFANAIKKVTLVLDRKGERAAARALGTARTALAEELVDTFIYLIRLSALLNVDLEAEYLKKLRKNKLRFRKFARMPQSRTR